MYMHKYVCMLVSMFKVDKELTTTTAAAAKITMGHNIEKKKKQKRKNTKSGKKKKETSFSNAETNTIVGLVWFTVEKLHECMFFRHACMKPNSTNRKIAENP